MPEKKLYDSHSSTYSKECYADGKQSYLVLSGGLGSSPYVQSCIKARYQIGTSGLLPGTENLQVLVAFEP